MTAPTVLLTSDFHPAGLEVLRSAGAHVATSAPDPERLLQAAPHVEAVVARANARLDRLFFEHAGRLRVVGRFGVGVDNINLTAAREHGVVVVNAPGANSTSVVEHALACMLALSRRLPDLDRQIRHGDWGVRDRVSGRELADRVLGVVGLGAIGGGMARACRLALGMEVVYHDTVERPALSVGLSARRVELERLLRDADVVTVHVPLTDDTRHLIDAEALALMKPDAILLNFARGGVVDEVALTAALAAGRLYGAALDVFEEEPLPTSSPLLDAPNLILTPHTAGLSEEANARVSVQIATDIVAVLAGRAPIHPVPAPADRAGLQGASA